MSKRAKRGTPAKGGTALRRFQRHEQASRVTLPQRSYGRGTSLDPRLTHPLPTRKAYRDPLVAENMRRIRARQPTITRVSR